MRTNLGHNVPTGARTCAIEARACSQTAGNCAHRLHESVCRGHMMPTVCARFNCAHVRACRHMVPTVECLSAHFWHYRMVCGCDAGHMMPTVCAHVRISTAHVRAPVSTWCPQLMRTCALSAHNLICTTEWPVGTMVDTWCPQFLRLCALQLRTCARP